MRMKLLAVMLSLCTLLPLSARADIWLCLSPENKQSIQDRPCGKGLRQKSHVTHGQRVQTAPTVRSQSSGQKSSVEVGLQRNKAVICGLLNTEKSDALAQIGGGSKPPPGENPRDNLAKIEKQRARVGCDAS